MASLARRGAATPTRTSPSGWGSPGRAITESLALAEMPDEVRNLCRLADISSKSLLLQVVRQQTPQKMIAFIEQLTREGQGGRSPGSRPGRPLAPKPRSAGRRPSCSSTGRRPRPSTCGSSSAKADVDRDGSHRGARGHHRGPSQGLSPERPRAAGASTVIAGPTELPTASVGFSRGAWCVAIPSDLRT